MIYRRVINDKQLHLTEECMEPYHSELYGRINCLSSTRVWELEFLNKHDYAESELKILRELLENAVPEYENDFIKEIITDILDTDNPEECEEDPFLYCEFLYCECEITDEDLKLFRDVITHPNILTYPHVAYVSRNSGFSKREKTISKEMERRHRMHYAFHLDMNTCNELTYENIKRSTDMFCLAHEILPIYNKTEEIEGRPQNGKKNRFSHYSVMQDKIVKKK